MLKKIFLFLISIFIFASCAPVSINNKPAQIDSVSQSAATSLEQPAGGVVKIGIIMDTVSVSVSSEIEFYLTDALGRKIKLSKGTVSLAVSSGTLNVSGKQLSLPVTVENSKNIVYADKKPYRGSFLIAKSGNKVNVINVLTIDEYLKGVLPKEMNVKWGIEALKAQAVISRTYTLANLGRHKAQSFDLCNTTDCQVYGGIEGESEQTNKAVDETKGEVVLYNGKYAQTVFHANCGGHTEDPQYVWSWKQPTPEYLKGVKCDYCADAPYTKWETSIDSSLISKKLKTAGFDAGDIKSIKIKGVTDAGSAKELEIAGSKSTVVMNAYKFRLAVDAWQIKSVAFDSITSSNGKFVFKGKGWGHRVGLCQWGAKGMADKNKNYKEILKFYYPGTQITTIN